MDSNEQHVSSIKLTDVVIQATEGYEKRLKLVILKVVLIFV